MDALTQNKHTTYGWRAASVSCVGLCVANIMVYAKELEQEEGVGYLSLSLSLSGKLASLSPWCGARQLRSFLAYIP